MKKYLSFIMLLAFMLSMVSITFADTTVTIGTGTANQLDPFNASWGYGRSLGLYTSAEIGQFGLITTLGWSVASAGGANIPYKIYAKFTDDTALTPMTWDTFTSTAIVVKEGSYAFNSTGWHNFLLDIPIAYTGGNLIIGVEANYGGNGAGAGNYPYFHYSTQAAGSHQKWQEITNPPTVNGTLNIWRPNLLLTLSALSDDPLFVLSPPEWDFESVRINTAAIKTFYIVNAGGRTFNLTSLSPMSGGFFEVTDAPTFPVSLATGESASFTIEYLPTAVGNHTATFTITDGRATTELVVSGECHDQYVSTFPYTDGNFENGGALPLEWFASEGSAGAPIHWAVSTGASANGPSAPFEGSYFALLNDYYAIGHYNPYYLTMRPLALDGSPKQLSYMYWLGDEGYSENPLSVQISTDNQETWTTLYTHDFDNTSSWQNNIVSLSAYVNMNVFIRFAALGSPAICKGLDLIKVEEPPMGAPLPPILVTPTNGSTMISRTPIFGWYFYPGPVATGYKVYCDTNNPPTTEIADVATISYTHTTELLPETVYYWTVKAYNDEGIGEAAATFSFTTMPEGLVNIGDGTANNNLPVNPYYGYSYSQSIYLQPEINISNQRIEKIAYYWNGYQAAPNSSGWTVYMGHTDKTVFANASDWIPLTQLTPVYVGPPVNIPDYAGWVEVELTNPFIYNNIDNLVIAVDENTPAYESNSAFFFTTATTGMYRSLTYYNNSTNPDPASPPATGGFIRAAYPNIMIQFGDLPPNPVFTYNPDNIDFGTVTNGVTGVPANVSVSNMGSGTINLNASDISIIGPNAAEFAFDPINLPASLSTAQSVNIPVTVTGITEGDISATLRFTYDGDYYDVALSANVLPAGIVFIGDGTANNNLPIYPYFNYSYSQSIYLQNEINISDQRIERLSFYWNGATVGTNNREWVIFMAHTDMDSFSSSTAWAPYADLTQVFDGEVNLPAAAGWVEIVLQNPFVYNNNDNLLICVDENTPGNDGSSGFFHSTAATSTRGLIFYNDSTNPDPVSPPTANGVKSAYANIMLQFGDLPPNPEFTYTPDNIDFGTIFANTVTEYQNVRVVNTGAGVLNLSIADISILGPDATMFGYAPIHLPFALGPGESGIIPVIYNPSAEGSHTATLYMVYDGVSYEVALSGTALNEHALFESFESTTFPPPGWANPGSWTRNTTYAKNGTASAYKAGSAYTQYVLSMPMLTIEDGSVFNFWARSSSNTGILQLVYSENRSTWAQVGDNITFPDINTWYQYNIDLSSIPGNYYLGLRTGLVSATYYTDMYIGPNITPLAPGAPVLSAPAASSTNMSVFPTFTWTTPTTGGVPTSYNIYCDENNPPTTLIGSSTALSFTPTAALPYESTLYWSVTAVNSNGESEQAAARRFTTMLDPTIYDLPWIEDFTSSTFPPAKWARYTGLYPTETLSSTTAGWMRVTFANVYTPANYSARLNITGTAVKHWLVTPPIAIPTGAYMLEFDLALTTYSGSNPVNPEQQLDDRFMVFVADNPAMIGATILRQWDNAGSSYVYNDIATLGEKHFLDLSAHEGIKYIAFYGESTATGGNNNVYVDNVQVRESPVNPVFTYTPDEIDFGTVRNGVTSVPVNVSVSNMGGGTISLNASDISIIGPNAAEFAFDSVNLPASLAIGQSVDIPVTVTGVTEGDISATLCFTYGGDYYEVALSANVLPAGIVIIGEGSNYNSTTDYPAVYGGYWKNSREQYIITADELTASGVQAGFLHSISFNVFYPYDSANLPNFTIQMGLTTATEFVDTNFLTGLTEVFSTSLYTPTAGWNGHTLSSPFFWDGASNIVIQTSFDMLPSYVQHASTYYTSTFPSNKTLYYNSDYDAWNTVATGIQSTNRPNMMLQITELIIGSPAEPILSYPADGAINLPKAGFNLTWSPDLVNGGVPDYYAVFLASDEGSIYDEYYWETENTYFNPVTEGGMSYDYLERWYWTVQAINNDGDVVADPPYSFVIEDDPTINTFPWMEDFEAHADNSLPAGWSRSSNALGWLIGTDLSSTYFTIPTHTVYAAANDDAGGASSDSSLDYLNMPVIDLSGITEGIPVLSFDSFYTFPYNQLANVEASTDGVNWDVIFTVPANNDWVNQGTSLADFVGENELYIRFHSGDYDDWASGWAIDNVNIQIMFEDTLPPTIVHLPLLNNPRDDADYIVSAVIVDDTAWNNPISGAQLYYDAGDGEVMVNMLAGADDVYTAAIPAQELGTWIDYYIKAWDSEDNVTQTNEYGFEVDNPAWLLYSGFPTTYMGSPDSTFGAGIIFENPYYGSGIPLQVLALQLLPQNSTTAVLMVYEFDGDDLTPAMDAMNVNLTADYAEFDLEALEVIIESPLFAVTYQNIPSGNYFAWNEHANYGMSLFNSGSGWGFLSDEGTWIFTALVTNAATELDAPEVNIALIDGDVVLDWNPVDGAASYHVLGSDDPYTADPWTLLNTVSTPEYTHSGSEAMQYFKVIADSDAATKGRRQIVRPERPLNNVTNKTKRNIELGKPMKMLLK